MATFAILAAMPFVQIVVLYAVVNRLTSKQQDLIVASARYWRVR